MELTIKTKLDFSGLQSVKEACEELSKKVRVGIIHNPEEAEIGYLQHFGGVGVYQYGPYEGEEVRVPPRPFLSAPIEHYGKEILESDLHLLKDFTKEEAKTILNRVGDKAKFVVQKEIDAIAARGGNSPRTIETKGKDSPLIDTGKMRDSIEYEVVR